MWENMLQPDWPPDHIARRMRFAYWIAKDADNHSEYVILIVFPRQEMLPERASILLLYVHCLSCLNLSIGYLWLKHNWAHRLRINRTQRSIRLVRYDTWRRKQSRLRNGWDAKMDKSKTVHCFWMAKNCSFFWNSEKGKCVVVKKTYCNSPAYAWPKYTIHIGPLLNHV
jgi:hypothetical protein